MKLICLGMIFMALIASIALNLAFYSGRLTPEQELLVSDMDRVSCTHAQDEVDCLMRVSGR